MHTDANIAIALTKACKKWEIDSKIDLFIMNNASNNDTAVDTLSEYLSNFWSDQKCFCLSHVINLIVKATLFDKHCSRFKHELADASDAETFEL